MVERCQEYDGVSGALPVVEHPEGEIWMEATR
jgi:hypothetical protein